MKRTGVSQKFQKVKKKRTKEIQSKRSFCSAKIPPPLTREISRILSNEISGTNKKRKTMNTNLGVSVTETRYRRNFGEEEEEKNRVSQNFVSDLVRQK